MKSFFQFLNEAQSQASMQAKKLNLVSDGHGGWLDSRGKFVATTEDGKLKFVDKKKAKAEDEPTAQPKAAKPEPKEEPKKTAPQETGAKKAEAGEGGEDWCRNFRSSDCCIWTFQSSNCRSWQTSCLLQRKQHKVEI